MSIKKPARIEITTRSLVLALVMALVLYGLFLIRDIIILFFLSFLFMSVVNPFVDTLERRGLPRALGILLIYLLGVLVVLAIFFAMVPPLLSQASMLFERLGDYSFSAPFLFGREVDIVDIRLLFGQTETVPRVVSLVGSTFSLLVYLMTFAMMGFYLLLERRQLHQYLVWIFGGENESERKAEQFINDIEHQMGDWSRGQLVLMAIVGLLTYLGLTFLGIPFALPLALIAGLLEILPNIGPTVSAIPAVIVALSTASPALAFGVIALYIIVQQLENHVFFPQVMSHAVHLHPILTILAVLSGYRLGQGIGAVIAIPVVLISKVVIRAYLRHAHDANRGSVSSSQKAWRRVSQILF